jgi:hypothetical protein
MDRLFRSITKKRAEHDIFREELVKLWSVAFREARLSLAPKARPRRLGKGKVPSVKTR